MRLQTLSRNHALPSRGPRILSRNRDRVHSLGHAVASPQSSQHRTSECDAGYSPHKALANNLTKLATSPSAPSARLSGGLMGREARPINPDRTGANAPLIRPVMASKH